MTEKSKEKYKVEMDKLEPPSDFPFPFTPYSIQQDFMRSLYEALEMGKLGIFESPTGTGKSLSLICGALSWLRDHEARELTCLETKFRELSTLTESQDGGSDPFDWLKEQAQQVEARQLKAKIKLQLDALRLQNEKMAKVKQNSKKRKDERARAPAFINRKHGDCKGTTRSEKEENDVAAKSTDFDDEDELILEEIAGLVGSPEHVSDEEEDQSDQAYQRTKIYFCSRTHSQLAQFVGEVKRSHFGNDISLVPLASRQSYCINDSVQNLKNLTLINERCLDLQRNKTSRVTGKSEEGAVTKKSRSKSKGSSHCPALNHSAIECLSEDTLSEVQDVEQIVLAGRKLCACPYYSSRLSVANAQVIVLPYNTLLHKATRQACGIHLTNSVVIIDEAHNLLEAIGHIHSALVSGQQLAHAHSQLVQYRDRYQSRFSAVNLLYLNQVIFVVGKLIRILGGKPGCDPSESITKVVESKLYTLPDFVLSAEIDNLNLFKMLDFCKKSKISHKLNGFVEHYQPSVKIHKPATKTQGIRAFLMEIENADKSDATQSNTENVNDGGTSDVINLRSNSPFLPVLGFLETLTNASEDGRILLKREPSVGRGTLKFLLLNPAAHFRDIVREARSVIVAGGTMQPVSEFQNQLFLSAGGDPERVVHFSCGHVIPPENILPIALGAGPTDKIFDFSYSQRDSNVMISELGRLLVNICNIVPAGIVCFFPSYEYEKHLIGCFEKSGILDKLQQKKKVFREPKRASDVDAVLTDYAKCIRHASNVKGKLSGSLLFSVIGGKLSEGLNFSDDLGRCVIVVGLPYPNIKSVELQEQMKYLDVNVGRGAGQTHYENLCMKAVNQSIGRAVRHKDDFASVLLLDRRYLQQSRQNCLPKWIQASLQIHERFGPAYGSLCKFFRDKRSS